MPTDFEANLKERAARWLPVESLPLSTEDAQAALSFADAWMVKREDWFAYEVFLSFLMEKIGANMKSFGEDGMGDKPETMNRIEYWVQHLNPEHFVEEDEGD